MPAGKRAFERDERRGVGAGEAVDRLRGIADDGEIGRVAEPGAQQPELQRRRVLELVDEEVPEPPALPGRELLVARDRVGAAAAARRRSRGGDACASRPRSGVNSAETSPAAAGRAPPGRLGRRLVPLRARSGAPSPIRSRPRRRRPRSPTPGPGLPTSGASRRALRSRTVGASRLRSLACRRSWARAIAWNVPAVIRPSTPSRPMRETSSPAALRVNVTAST